MSHSPVFSRSSRVLRLAPLAALAAALCAPAVQAEGWTPSAAFVQPAIGPNSIYSLSGGVVWPWSWKSSSGAWTGYTELLVGVWSAEAVTGGRDTFNHVAVSPIFRYNFDGGRSPWFFEGGIGMSYTSPLYVTRSKTFSTKLNFADTIGIGRTFGEGGRQSVTLRLQHLSNASIKKPNPGEEFLQLRYTWSF